jgi:hypothetical protein
LALLSVSTLGPQWAQQWVQ